jgi:hypothetical protein
VVDLACRCILDGPKPTRLRLLKSARNAPCPAPVFSTEGRGAWECGVTDRTERAGLPLHAGGRYRPGSRNPIQPTQADRWTVRLVT